MAVFDAEFVTEMARKHARRPRSYQPDLYFVTTSPARETLRSWIESKIDAVPEPGRTRITNQLRSDDHFVETLNELAVHSTLAEAGFTAHYEPDLDGVTPDLLVPATAARNALIVEVWTRKLPAAAANRRRAWQALRERVGKDSGKCRPGARAHANEPATA